MNPITIKFNLLSFINQTYICANQRIPICRYQPTTRKMESWQIITKKIIARTQNSYQSPAVNPQQYLKSQLKPAAAEEVDKQYFLQSKK